MIHPTEINDLVSFWDFQEPGGQLRKAKGGFPAELQEAGGPVERIEGGVFGKYCANLAYQQRFVIPHPQCGELRLQECLSVVAWIQRYRKPEIECEAIAGMWNETLSQRQYALFLDLRIHGGADNVCGHLSSSGGPTPSFRWCMDAAIGGGRVPYFDWRCVAFTYDGLSARAYLDGDLHERAGLNPFPYPGGIFPGTSDFTVGAVHRKGEMGNWFVGRLGGLAVYRRALDADEVVSLSKNVSNGFPGTKMAASA